MARKGSLKTALTADQKGGWAVPGDAHRVLPIVSVRGEDLAVLGVLRLFAGLDDVALGEEDLLQGDPPVRRPADQELEVHPEVLELLALRVRHDRLRLGIGLECHPLLVPADRLRLFGHRRDHPGERAPLGAQFFCRFVVLVETHLASLIVAPYCPAGASVNNRSYSPRQSLMMNLSPGSQRATRRTRGRRMR